MVIRILIIGAQFWLSLMAPGSRDLLYGNWQSCLDDMGYQERIVDFKRGQPGVYLPFELHMGPQNDFAVMAGVHDEHRPHDLTRWHWEMPRWTTGKALHVMVQELRLQLDVTRAGGSREECESYVVHLRRTQ